MQNKVYTYYKELPSWAKGIAVLGVGVVAFLVGRKLYKVAFPSLEEQKSKQMLNNINSDIRKNLSLGLKPSFADSNYNTFANTIYEGMRYAVGDDYGTVEATMKKMMNNLDVAKLIQAFGLRQNYIFGIPKGSPVDLFTMTQQELGNEYLGVTNYRVKNINADWKKKGITYQL
jgi:hypothetical protein